MQDIRHGSIQRELNLAIEDDVGSNETAQIDGPSFLLEISVGDATNATKDQQ